MTTDDTFCTCTPYGKQPATPHTAEADPIRQALAALVAADNCNYDRDAMRSEGLFEAAREVLKDAS